MRHTLSLTCTYLPCTGAMPSHMACILSVAACASIACRLSHRSEDTAPQRASRHPSRLKRRWSLLPTIKSHGTVLIMLWHLSLMAQTMTVARCQALHLAGAVSSVRPCLHAHAEEIIHTLRVAVAMAAVCRRRVLCRGVG